MPFRFRHRGRSVPPAHPRRAHIHEHADTGARIGEAVTRQMGSMRFIAIQTVIIIAWLIVNIYLLGRHPFDPYPFILLNLLFSTQAAYASPLILLAQNRQAERDRKRDDTEAAEVEDLHDMGKMQLDILAGQDEVLKRLDTLTQAVHQHVLTDQQQRKEQSS